MIGGGHNEGGRKEETHPPLGEKALVERALVTLAGIMFVLGCSLTQKETPPIPN